jgi:hypothetical protein
MRHYWIVPTGVLIALLIAGFFVGWIQLLLAPDTYGVIFTRAHGLEKSVVRPEGITWRWERIIPGALTLYRFPLTAQSMNLSISGILPSGDVYAALTPEHPDFSFQLHLSGLYRLKPEALPGLTDTVRLRPDGLSDLYATWSEQMRSKATEIALGAEVAAAPAASGTGLPDVTGGIAELIAAQLPRSFPHLEFVSLAATVVRVPDVALYAQLRNTYLGMAAARESTMKNEAARLAVQEVQQKAAEERQERNLAILGKYGELLDKHPALIKFLFLTTAKSFSPQDLQNLDLLDRLNRLE